MSNIILTIIAVLSLLACGRDKGQQSNEPTVQFITDRPLLERESYDSLDRMIRYEQFQYNTQGRPTLSLQASLDPLSQDTTSATEIRKEYPNDSVVKETVRSFGTRVSPYARTALYTYLDADHKQLSRHIYFSDTLLTDTAFHNIHVWKNNRKHAIYGIKDGVYESDSIVCTWLTNDRCRFFDYAYGSYYLLDYDSKHRIIYNESWTQDTLRSKSTNSYNADTIIANSSQTFNANAISYNSEYQYSYFQRRPLTYARQTWSISSSSVDTNYMDVYKRHYYSEQGLDSITLDSTYNSTNTKWTDILIPLGDNRIRTNRVQNGRTISYTISQY